MIRYLFGIQLSLRANISAILYSSLSASLVGHRAFLRLNVRHPVQVTKPFIRATGTSTSLSYHCPGCRLKMLEKCLREFLRQEEEMLDIHVIIRMYNFIHV